MAAPAMYPTRTRHSLFVIMVSYLWLHPSRVVPGVGVARSTDGTEARRSGLCRDDKELLAKPFPRKRRTQIEP
jgi:hypothetical protein